MAENEILFEEVSGVHNSFGLITLNRPKALNALSFDMIQRLAAKLQQWQTNENIGAVIITAAPGRAFCAGGDIRKVYEAMLNNDENAKDFFWNEYRLNFMIHNFSKPYVAIMDGIVMGGGVGVSMHGDFRIATDNMTFAMPETGIGFFPDIGSSYLLSRLPRGFGLYLGLTGEMISAAEAYHYNYVDAIFNQTDIENFLEKIKETEINRFSIKEAMKSFNQGISSEIEIDSQQKEAFFDEVFTDSSIESIIENLQSKDDEFSNALYKRLQMRSPTSLKVTFKQLLLAEELSFADCLKMDYKLAVNFLKSHDFKEGIRAVVIDKDKKPSWNPKELSSITDEVVAGYFEDVDPSLDLPSS